MLKNSFVLLIFHLNWFFCFYLSCFWTPATYSISLYKVLAFSASCSFSAESLPLFSSFPPFLTTLQWPMNQHISSTVKLILTKSSTTISYSIQPTANLVIYGSYVAQIGTHSLLQTVDTTLIFCTCLLQNIDIILIPRCSYTQTIEWCLNDQGEDHALIASLLYPTPPLLIKAVSHLSRQTTMSFYYCRMCCGKILPLSILRSCVGLEIESHVISLDSTLCTSPTTSSRL